jgi:two-component system response regulator
MTRRRRRVTVLVADGDAEGRRLMGEAFAARRPDCDLRFAGDGEELLNYLCRRGPYREPARSPRPGLLLLGWDLPGKGGPESLRAIRADPASRPLPVVVLGTSEAGGDAARAYDLDAASFILKPTTPEGMAGVVEALGRYWLDVVELPDADKGDADGPPPR